MIDTIFARATASGRGAIAVVRISGSLSETAVKALAGALPAPRHATVRRLTNGDGEVIDQAVVLWTPGPASFTGEDSAELHIHGGQAVLEAVAGCLLAQGLRWADPGEFSRRAFTNGKMDLLQAEAVADLVDAETDAQRRQALAQMSGDVGGRLDAWRTALVDAAALLEAENDFPDEDLPGALATQAREALEVVRLDLEQALSTASRGRRVREGYRIALIGEPNAGKSSLLNGLVEREAAIVSRLPGTTRDVVEVSTLIRGHRVLLADTAGVRETEDEVEAEGVRRAQAWAEDAALRLIVVAPSQQPGAAVTSLAQEGDLVVQTHADLASATNTEAAVAGLDGLDVLNSSVVTAGGLSAVSGWLDRRVGEDMDASEPPAATRERHELALREALACIDAAQTTAELAPERAVEDVRRATRALRSLVGEVDREDVLDRVFSSFCIGK